MFRHILAPLSPSMDTELAQRIGAALAHGAETPTVSVAPLEPFPPASGAEPPVAGVERVGGTGTERQIDLIIVTPKRRELCEIEWYPHTASWELLRLRTPILFWPPDVIGATLLSGRRPVIVVALDGHKHSEQAIPFGCALAEAFGGEVLLARVVPPSFGERQLRKASPAVRRQRLEQVHEVWLYLQMVRDTTAKQTSATVTTKILLGEPGTALVQLAQRRNVGALVMTTHSRAHDGHFFAGAVATQALRQSPAPTLLIPLGAETEPGAHTYLEPAIPVTP